MDSAKPDRVVLYSISTRLSDIINEAFLYSGKQADKQTSGLVNNYKNKLTL